MREQVNIHMLKFYGHFLKKRNFFAVKFSSLYSDIFFRFGLWHLYWGLVCSKFIWVPIWTHSILLLLLVMLWQSIFQNCGFWGAMCFWGATTCIGKIPYAPPLFENSAACRGLKICTHHHTKGLYKSDATIFLILSNFEIMGP